MAVLGINRTKFLHEFERDLKESYEGFNRNKHDFEHGVPGATKYLHGTLIINGECKVVDKPKQHKGE